MLSRTIPNVKRMLQRCLHCNRPFSTITTATNPSPFDSSNHHHIVLQSQTDAAAPHPLSNPSPLEYLMKNILEVNNINMERIRLIQKDDFSNKMDHFQKLLTEAESCVMDCKMSESKSDQCEEEQREARDAVKELLFEFLELVDDLNYMSHGSEVNVARQIQHVRKQMEGMEDIIDDCNPLQLEVIITNIYGASQLIHDIERN